MFRSLYMRMKELTQTHLLTFIVINQITSYYTESGEFLSKRAGQPVVPALGSTITQFTQNRYMLCRRNETYPAITIADIDKFTSVFEELQGNVPTNPVRDFYVIFSPLLGERKTSFTITVDGVVSASLVCLDQTVDCFSSVITKVASLGLIM